ncbi:LysR substrate-binding domain-containing protein, partial [Actinomadura adrarensis]
TPGRILVDRADEVFRSLEAAERELREHEEMRSGLLRLGWFATAGTTLVPWAIAAFRQIAPTVRLDLFEGDPDQCVPRLHARELELGLVYRFTHEPPLDAGLEQIELFDDQLHIGLPPGHRLAGRDRVALADLAGDAWIQGVREGSTLGVLPRACRLEGFEPIIALRTDDRMAVEGLVAAGVGIALFPLLTLPAVRQDIVIRPLDARELFRRVTIALPPGTYRSPATLTMIDVLQRTCARLRTKAARRLASS